MSLVSIMYNSVIVIEHCKYSISQCYNILCTCLFHYTEAPGPFVEIIPSTSSSTTVAMTTTSLSTTPSTMATGLSMCYYSSSVMNINRLLSTIDFSFFSIILFFFSFLSLTPFLSQSITLTLFSFHLFIQ